MAKLIVIEGLDGCGKSTLLLELLQKVQNSVKLSKRDSWLPEAINKSKDNQYACGYNINNLHFLYLMAQVELSKQVKEDSSDVTYIASRWLAGEVALYEIYAKHHGLNMPELSYSGFPILKPDKVIYLKPPFDVRIDRLNTRNKYGKGPNYFDEMTMTENSELVMQKHMGMIYGDNYLTIDNSQPFEETIKQVLSYVS